MIEKRKRFGANVSCLVLGMILLVGCSENSQEKIEMDLEQAMQEELKVQEIQKEKQELKHFNLQYRRDTVRFWMTFKAICTLII